MEQLTFIEQAQLFAANHSILVFAWVALLIAVILSIYKGATSKFKVVTNAQAVQLINKEEGVVVDVRTEEEFRTGHIVDSVHVFPSDIKANKIQNLEKYKERPVILVDTNGLTSSSSATSLVKQGFVKVYVLREGIVGWRTENLPTVKKHK